MADDVREITKPAPHVYKAISAVMEGLAKEGIGKNNKNTQQNYKFRGVDDVYNALAPILAKQQLCVIPRMLSRDHLERQTKSGAVLFYVTVTAEFDFVSALDGTTHKVGPFFGEAMDSGDKATNKAMSAAYKYMAFQTFCIPTEGDNDADATTHEVAPAADRRPSPSHPPAGQQPPASPDGVRPQARRFVNKACEDIVAAEGDIDAVWSTFEDIKGREGWKQLTAAERQVIILAKGKALPDDPS